MRNWLVHLTLNQRLALLALVLGAAAVFATPYQGGVVTLDARELARIVDRQVDRVEPTQLAAWIIAERADYRLVDLRDAQAFAQYHIPSADNVPAGSLLDAGLGRQERIVLYAEDGVRAAQAWMLLRTQGYRGVYMLDGGLQAWKDQVVYPVIADNPTPDQKATDDRLASVAAFFGGAPRSAGAVAAGVPVPAAMGSAGSGAVPKVEAPATPAGAKKPAPRKKKEGC